MDELRTLEAEPVKAAGIFGKVMAEVSARAKEYRAQELTGNRKNGIKLNVSDWPVKEAAIKGCPQSKWGKTFESFDLIAAPAMANAYERTRWYAATPERWCLVLSGEYGTGKTHLAYAAANYRREHNLPYLMLTAPALMAKLKNSIDEKRLSIETHGAMAWGPEEWVCMYGTTEALLILDDFGAQQDTEWATTQLFSVLNSRYDRELPTLLTTNLGAKQMDPRIVSRIAGGLIVCKGGDQRARFE